MLFLQQPPSGKEKSNRGNGRKPDTKSNRRHNGLKSGVRAAHQAANPTATTRGIVKFETVTIRQLPRWQQMGWVYAGKSGR